MRVGYGCCPQVFDMAQLFRGCFIGDSNAPRLNNSIVESFIASMSIVILLAAVVGLDYNMVRFDPHVARAAKLVVEGCGDMVQECTEGYPQSSFRIYPFVPHVQ